MTILVIVVLIIFFTFPGPLFLLKLPKFKENPNKSSLVLRAAYISVVLPTLFLLGISILYYDLYKVHIIVDSDFLGYFTHYRHEVSEFLNRHNADDITKAVVTSFGLFLVVLWNLTKTYEDKWKYAASMFNGIIKMLPKNEREYCMKENYSACLAMDLEAMGLHNHESFKPFYKEVLSEANVLGKDLTEYQEHTTKQLCTLNDKFKEIKEADA